jgi:hypothetical protein
VAGSRGKCSVSDIRLEEIWINGRGGVWRERELNQDLFLKDLEANGPLAISLIHNLV